MRKFCISGFLFGLAFSGAAILASRLTGNSVQGNDFGRYLRFFWPSAVLFAAPDPKFSSGVILTFRLISIGANGVFYAFLGLMAFFVDRLVDRVSNAISADQAHSRKA
jgi:hypothetical protein